MLTHFHATSEAAADKPLETISTVSGCSGSSWGLQMSLDKRDAPAMVLRASSNSGPSSDSTSAAATGADPGYDPSHQLHFTAQLPRVPLGAVESSSDPGAGAAMEHMPPPFSLPAISSSGFLPFFDADITTAKLTLEELLALMEDAEGAGATPEKEGLRDHMLKTGGAGAACMSKEEGERGLRFQSTTTPAATGAKEGPRRLSSHAEDAIAAAAEQGALESCLPSSKAGPTAEGGAPLAPLAPPISRTSSSSASAEASAGPIPAGGAPHLKNAGAQGHHTLYQHSAAIVLSSNPGGGPPGEGGANPISNPTTLLPYAALSSRFEGPAGAASGSSRETLPCKSPAVMSTAEEGAQEPRHALTSEAGAQGDVSSRTENTTSSRSSSRGTRPEGRAEEVVLQRRGSAKRSGSETSKDKAGSQSRSEARGGSETRGMTARERKRREKAAQQDKELAALEEIFRKRLAEKRRSNDPILHSLPSVASPLPRRGERMQYALSATARPLPSPSEGLLLSAAATRMADRLALDPSLLLPSFPFGPDLLKAVEAFDGAEPPFHQSAAAAAAADFPAASAAAAADPASAAAARECDALESIQRNLGAASCMEGREADLHSPGYPSRVPKVGLSAPSHCGDLPTPGQPSLRYPHELPLQLLRGSCAATLPEPKATAGQEAQLRELKTRIQQRGLGVVDLEEASQKMLRMSGAPGRSAVRPAAEDPSDCLPSPVGSNAGYGDALWEGPEAAGAESLMGVPLAHGGVSRHASQLELLQKLIKQGSQQGPGAAYGGGSLDTRMDGWPTAQKPSCPDVPQTGLVPMDGRAGSVERLKPHGAALVYQSGAADQAHAPIRAMQEWMRRQLADERGGGLSPFAKQKRSLSMNATGKAAESVTGMVTTRDGGPRGLTLPTGGTPQAPVAPTWGSPFTAKGLSPLVSRYNSPFHPAQEWEPSSARYSGTATRTQGLLSNMACGGVGDSRKCFSAGAATYFRSPSAAIDCPSTSPTESCPQAYRTLPNGAGFPEEETPQLKSLKGGSGAQGLLRHTCMDGFGFPAVSDGRIGSLALGSAGLAGKLSSLQPSDRTPAPYRLDLLPSFPSGKVGDEAAASKQRVPQQARPNPQQQPHPVPSLHIACEEWESASLKPTLPSSSRRIPAHESKRKWAATAGSEPWAAPSPRFGHSGLGGGNDPSTLKRNTDKDQE